MSGEYFVFPAERPVEPPQLLADFAPRGAVLDGFGGGRTAPGGPLARWTGGVVAGPGIGWCFHGTKMVASYAPRVAEKIRHPRADSFGFEKKISSLKIRV